MKTIGEMTCLEISCEKCPYFPNFKHCMSFKRVNTLNEGLEIIKERYLLDEIKTKKYEELLKEEYKK